MPILGLTDQSALGSGLPRIAKLYKGDEKPETGNRPGKDLTYFRVEFEPQFAELLPLWQELYGDQPTEFAPVFLTAATVDEAFSSWKEDWNASQTLLHRCDGENQVQWYDAAIQKTCSAKIPCVAPQCGCKNIGRLNLLLPEFIDAAGVLGTISVSTHSINDILTVYRYLADIERIYGTLTQIPFVFGRTGKEIGVPKQVKRGDTYVNDGRIKVSKSLFYIHATTEFTQQRLLPTIAAALPAPDEVALTPDEGRRLLGNGRGNRRLAALPTPAQPSEIEGEEDSDTEPEADWTAFWLVFKQNGFTPGNREQIKLVLKVDDIYEITPVEAWKRLKAYCEGKPTYGANSGAGK